MNSNHWLLLALIAAMLVNGDPMMALWGALGWAWVTR